jgi:hypothetical protein
VRDIHLGSVVTTKPRTLYSDDLSNSAHILHPISADSAIAILPILLLIMIFFSLQYRFTRSRKLTFAGKVEISMASIGLAASGSAALACWVLWWQSLSLSSGYFNDRFGHISSASMAQYLASATIVFGLGLGLLDMFCLAVVSQGTRVDQKSKGARK